MVGHKMLIEDGRVVKKGPRRRIYIACAATVSTILLLFGAYIIFLSTRGGPAPLRCGVRDYENDRPIIGILSQEPGYLNTKYPKENYTSYIAASYVKIVEASGARVVPIMIGKNRSYYEDIMSKINGVLLPGGGTSFKESDGYADAGQHIFEIAKDMNDHGAYFPLFGICLGFELLIILDSGRGEPENRVKCYSHDLQSLKFAEDYLSSRMFKDSPKDIIDTLKGYGSTVNSHNFCIVDENLKSHNLTEHWRVTSRSKDEHSVTFIASIEHKKYPFYGVQFHPEKTAFEWQWDKFYPRTTQVIKANRYFIDFFVGESKKSYNHFVSDEEEDKYVIYNYEPLFTGKLGSAYEQSYLFEPRGTME